MKDPDALIRTVADGLSHRIDTVAGDYNKDELPQGYDIAFLSAIIHSNSPKQNQALFIKNKRRVKSRWKKYPMADKFGTKKF